MKRKTWYIIGGIAIVLLVFYLVYWKDKLSLYLEFTKQVASTKKWITGADKGADWRSGIEQRAAQTGVSFEKRLDEEVKYSVRQSLGLGRNPTLFY